MRMNLKVGKASRGIRRGMAFVMAAAVGISMLVSAPSADAVASKKKPLIGTKTKTLYYNKADKKKYTLRIKKNGVKKITSTTWKSSRKNVVAVSSKKKMSVKLTAKKKGTSVITATVKYIPKGGWWNRTAKLTCKVTSKRKGADIGLVKTPKPTQTNPVQSKAASVSINRTSALLSKKEGYNTVNLTAVVQDAQGNPLKGENIVWVTDNAAVATVDEDGQVEAVNDGTARITASMDGIVSQPCVVTVDSVAPTIQDAVITGSRTLTVTFSESMKGNPVVSVRQNSSEELTYMDAVLEKDGKSIQLTNTYVLSAGTYLFTIEGLTDQAGNALEYNQKVVTKEESKPNAFVCKTAQIPVGQSKVPVYYAVTDQYGEELAFNPIEDLQVTAETESGMPLETRAKQDGMRGWIELSGAIGSLAAGREIQITLSSKALGLEGKTISTVLVDSEGVGKATEISGVVITGMENEGSELSPVLTIGSQTDENVFSLSTRLLDKFGLPVENAPVIYVIEDTNVLAFVNTVEPDSAKVNTSSDAVKVRALKGGETTVTAYLASDDAVKLPVRIRINPNKLTGITVTPPLDDGINGRATELETKLTPGGTGLTVDDLTYKVEEGERDNFDISFVEEEGKIYTKISAKANGKENMIQFRVVYDQVESDPVIYRSVPLASSVSEIQVDPFEEKGITVTAMGTATTEYRLINRYGEDITEMWEGKSPDTVIQNTDVIQNIELNAKGELKVTAKNQGEATVLLYLGEVTASLKIKVAATAHVSRIALGNTRGQLKRPSEVGSGEQIYIPIDHVEDQYGNKPYKLTAKEYRELKVKVAGGDPEPLKGSVFTITPCYNKKSADSVNNYMPIPDTDSESSVDAICVEWTDVPPTSLKTGSDCVLDFLYNGESVLDEEKFTLEIQEERRVNSITVENDGKEKVVATNATVSIAFTVKDQYGDNVTKFTDEDSSIGVEVIDAAGKNIVSGGDNELELKSTDDGRWSASFEVSDVGSYTFHVYKKVNKNTTYQNAAIRSEYALRAVNLKDAIKEIAVSPIVKKTITGDVVSLDLDALEKSPTDYIYVKPKDSVTITFEPVVKDADGNEITLSENDRDNIYWNVSSEDDIEQTSKPGESTITGGKAGEQGTITVSVSYIVGEMRINSEPRTIKVKCEKAIPQKDSYEIHRVTEDENDANDYKDNGFYEFSSAVLGTGKSVCTFEITAKDQNGNSCDPTEIQLDAVTVTGGKATVIKGPSNKFTVTMTQWGEEKINVYLSNATYQFSVGVIPNVMTAGLSDCGGGVTGALYTTNTYKVTTSLDRENSTDKFTVVTAEIKCAGLREHTNGVDQKGYWVGILVPLDNMTSKICVQDNKKASDIIKEIESGKQTLNDFTGTSAPDGYDKDKNPYWAFYYDKGATNEENEELGGYGVMKDSKDHYIVYMIDLSGVSKAAENQ